MGNTGCGFSFLCYLKTNGIDFERLKAPPLQSFILEQYLLPSTGSLWCSGEGPLWAQLPQQWFERLYSVEFSASDLTFATVCWRMLCLGSALRLSCRDTWKIKASLSCSDVTPSVWLIRFWSAVLAENGLQMLRNQFTPVVLDVSDMSRLYLMLQLVLQSYSLSLQKSFCWCVEVLDWERVLELKDLFLMNFTGKLLNSWVGAAALKCWLTSQFILHQHGFPGRLCYTVTLEGWMPCRFVCDTVTEWFVLERTLKFI